MTNIYLKEYTDDRENYDVIVQIAGNYDIENIQQHLDEFKGECIVEEGFYNLAMIIDELREIYQVEQVIDLDELEPIYY